MESQVPAAPATSARLALVGALCIEAIELHHERLLQALDDGAGVELELGDVSRVDTAGLQLLLGFVFELKRQGKEVRVVSASEVVKQCAMSAGVTEPLGL